MPRRIAIVGANAAGIDAASAARKTDRKAEIVLVTRESYPAYSRCGLPYVLAGEIPRFEDLIVFPPSYYRMMRLDLRTETDVKTVDPREKTLQLEARDGDAETLKYDSLILATGAYPFVPPIKGVDKKGVFSLRTIDDGKMVGEAMKDARTAVVVGAGFIGLEMAHAFVESDIKTTVVELLPYVLPAVLDKDMANLVQRGLEERGIRVITGRGVEEVTGGDHVEGALVAGEEIEADILMMAVGVRPNTELARQLGAEVGVTRGIKVNPRMMTTVPDIYAAGDCVESYNMLTGQPTMSQLGTTAVRQAKVAGINAAGGYAVFPGVLSSAVTRIFGFEVGATGFNEFWAQRAGFKTVSGSVSSTTKAHYFPGGEEIRVKVVAEPAFGRVIGCQIVGGEGVTQRVNVVSVAIQKQMTVWELAKADTCYAPPVNETWEVVALAAETAAMRLRR
ncbi:MAG: FAD-dependent oxidoreductase [Candidatus Bathyarchaeia archaeon]